MKKQFELVGLVVCFLIIMLAGNALPIPTEETLENLEEQADKSTARDEREKDCRIFFVKSDLGVQEASMDAGEPISSLHLFVTGTDGKIIKNAQLVTNIIDQQGNQQGNRALPYKGGYILAIDHLATGQYLVETEIVTKGQLLSDVFRFNKA